MKDTATPKEWVRDILKRHGVYTLDLEMDLLRHFDHLRLEMLYSIEAQKSGEAPDPSNPNPNINRRSNE